MMQREEKTGKVCEFPGDYSPWRRKFLIGEIRVGREREGRKERERREPKKEFWGKKKDSFITPKKTNLGKLIFIHGRKATPFCPDLSNIPFPLPSFPSLLFRLLMM